jgi:apolipoprotein N-acyltransferase
MEKKRLHYLSGRTLLQYVLPFAFLSFALITQQFHVTTDGGYSWMYGFPFPYITETWVTTFHHSVYILPMLVDFLIYLLVAIGLFVLLQSAGLVLRSHWFTIILVWLAVGALYSLQFFIFADYNSYNFLYDVDFTTIEASFSAGPYPY